RRERYARRGRSRRCDHVPGDRRGPEPAPLHSERAPHGGADRECYRGLAGADAVTAEMKVFVTGGNGFIGSVVVRDLVTSGHTVVCLLRRTSRTERIDDLGLGRVYGDVCD